MEGIIISGIQQIGIGVSNVRQAWKWYRENFGSDIRIFEEKAEARLMLPYTGGKPRKRHAILALNMQGGGGFEIWQYTERTPEASKFEILAGDLGIFIVKIKCKDIQSTYNLFRERKHDLSEIQTGPDGHRHFFIRDPFGNIFQLVNGHTWFMNDKKPTGLNYGAVIGVSDIEKSLPVYSGILGYDEVIYDKSGVQEDFVFLPGSQHSLRRVLLRHSNPRLGAFSRFLGESQIELIQVLDRQPQKIYHERLWGDLGFIHLCYDITGMEKLKEQCALRGYPFTVDSMEKHEGEIFDMGEAAGHFSYIEDPDGTLIEFVETHKVPISKKLGIYLNLKNRKPEKSLPNWMLKALRFNRFKEKS